MPISGTCNQSTFEKEIMKFENMIRFLDIDNNREVNLSYTQVAREFLDSPVSEEERGFVVNMMIFLDYIDRKKGLKFVKLNEEDWEELYQAAIREDMEFSKELVAWAIVCNWITS